MATEDEVRAASQTFYPALNRMLNGEASALGDIWSHGATVTTMHPIGGREMGWDRVRETWEQVAKQASAGNVQLNDQHIQASGDMACEVGTEKGQFTPGGQPVSIEHRVTNVYRRESGNWKIVHHHTDMSPAMIDAVSRLQK